ncbi:hypothetical protein AHAS_Ahas13G0392900 [Arachis hypogaea]
MFNNRLSFHMSSDGELLTVLIAWIESSRDVLMSNNLNCFPESGERRSLRIVVELDLDDVVDVVGVGCGAVIEDVEVDISGGRKAEEVGVPVTGFWKECSS